MSPGITLRLLGSAAIECDGQTLSGRAAQKRRLALLSLLALAPGRVLTRDRLLAYLWPESDTHQARHLLAVAVYEMRKVLGEDVVLTRGDDLELGARVAVDIDAFEAARSAGDRVTADTLYAGPFLDGFHINDAPDFERWADGERDRLSREHAEVLEGLARASALTGDAVGAVARWRALAVTDPFNTRVARELMLALEAAGDRAGALQVARVHTVMLKEEYGAQPDEEFLALDAKLREARVMPSHTQAVPIAATPEVKAPPVSPPAPVSPPPDPVIDDVVPTPPAATPRIPSKISSNWRPWVAAAAIIILVGAAYSAWPRLHAADGQVAEASTAATQTAALPASVAVLPFRNLDPSPEYALFGDGVAEEIALSLGRLEGLRVVGGSAITVASTDQSNELGRILGVSYLVEGTIRTGGGRIRIRATLIEAASHRQMWSESFDRPLQMADKLAVQEEIARAVVGALELELKGRAATEPLVPRSTDNLDAYKLYRRGRELFEKRTVPKLVEALHYFEEAAKVDDKYALAHAGQAEVYTILGAYDYSVLPPAEAFEKARSAARRALQLDPNLAQAYTALGSIAFNYDWNAEEAERAFQHAFSANRGYAPAYHWYSLFLATRGRMKESRDAILRAGELDPTSLVLRTALARPYYLERQYARAIELYSDAVRFDSTFVPARLGLALSHAGIGDMNAMIADIKGTERILGGPQPLTQALLGYAYGRTGDRATARKHLVTLQAMERKRYVAPEYFAIINIGLGDNDGAFVALERAITTHSGGIAYLGIEPFVDPIRSDPRFAKLLRRAGL